MVASESEFFRHLARHFKKERDGLWIVARLPYNVQTELQTDVSKVFFVL